MDEFSRDMIKFKPFKIGQNRWAVYHEEHGPVILNTKEQKYYYIENNVRFFEYKNGNKCRFFNTIEEFTLSETKFGVIPFVCTGIKRIKKRTMVNLMDRVNNIHYFYNVELIDNKWVRNK